MPEPRFLSIDTAALDDGDVLVYDAHSHTITGHAASGVAAPVQQGLSAHIEDDSNPHHVSKAQVGLGSVDNTSDANKPISIATAAALVAKAPLASPALTGVPTAPTPPPGTNTTQIATMAAVRAAIDALVEGAPGALDTLGEIAAQLSSDENAATAITTTLSNHTSDIANPHLVTKAQVGLGSADNTSDANKPISTATQSALNAKAPLASPSLTGIPTAPTAAVGTNTTQIATMAAVKAAIDALVGGAPGALDTLSEIALQLANDESAVAAITTTLGAHTSSANNPHGVTKTQVGLGNVDNTSDAAKPISTATQSALNAKAPLASPALTGIPTAPTAALGTNTTQLATMAAVKAAIDALVGGAPGALNTLGEIAAQLATDESAVSAITTTLGNHTSNTSNPHNVTADQIGATPAATSLLSWAYAQSYRLASGTRDSNGALTTGSLVWPNGATGTFTADTLSSAFPGAVDAYHVTHFLNGVTTTYTQPAVTRDATTGAVTAQPAIIVS